MFQLNLRFSIRLQYMRTGISHTFNSRYIKIRRRVAPGELLRNKTTQIIASFHGKEVERILWALFNKKLRLWWKAKTAGISLLATVHTYSACSATSRRNYRNLRPSMDLNLWLVHIVNECISMFQVDSLKAYPSSIPDYSVAYWSRNSCSLFDCWLSKWINLSMNCILCPVTVLAMVE